VITDVQSPRNSTEAGRAAPQPTDRNAYT